MPYLFRELTFEPGSRMTGIWTMPGAGVDHDSGREELATVHLVRLGEFDDGAVEARFLSSHLPWCVGGFHGVTATGEPWVVLIQAVPADSAAVVGADDPYWVATADLSTALGYAPAARIPEELNIDREFLLDAYAASDVDPGDVSDWPVTHLLWGLLAECCYVPLPDIVRGRLTQCAFPDEVHDCQHDVFTDVLAHWSTGALQPPESSPDFTDEDGDSSRAIRDDSVPEGYIAVDRDDWDQHPWLSGLTSGTDVDYSSMIGFLEAPAPWVCLDRVRLQYHDLDGQWKDLSRADGVRLPAYNEAPLLVGWFRETTPKRALIPAGWDLAELPGLETFPVVGYFTDWRTRTWQCDHCTWSGTNDRALVLTRGATAIACPDCGWGLARVYAPSDEELAQAVSDRHPEALAIAHPDSHGDPYEAGRGRRRNLTGHEQEVIFTPGDQFFGVPKEWLLARLRLDRFDHEVDLQGGLGIVLDNELVEDELNPASQFMGTGPLDGQLLAYECRHGLVSATWEVHGGWIEEWMSETSHSARWKGKSDGTLPTVESLRRIAVDLLSDLPEHELTSDDDFAVESPYLSADEPADQAVVLSAAGAAGTVFLNEVVIR